MEEKTPAAARAFYKRHHSALLTSGLLSTPYAFKINNNRTRAGVCKFAPVATIEVSSFFIKSPNITTRDIENTILHELAHAVVGPHVAAHGPEWQAAARSLGCDAKRCSPPFETDFKYIVACGSGCKITRHRKPTKFTRHAYNCKSHGGAIKVYMRTEPGSKKFKLIN
jgi:predicted SprT family Zn-dependent metalloprotease